MRFAQKKDFQGRLGIAWRPFGNKTVIRTGYGAFYGIEAQELFVLLLARTRPFNFANTFGSLAAPATLSNPYPAASKGVSSTGSGGYDLHGKDARLDEWNFTIEEQLPLSTVLELSYVGSKGTHLGMSYDINQPSPPSAPRPFLAFSPGAITRILLVANSHYHAFQATLRRRISTADFRVNYTFAKAIDDSRTLGSRGVNGSVGVEDPNHRNTNRGLSDFDRRHAFTANLLYRIPLGKDGKGLANSLIRDWQFNTFVGLFSGNPITPFDVRSAFGTAYLSLPDRLGNGNLAHPTPEMWFDVSAFKTAPATQDRFGTSGRGIITGPGNENIDLSLMRYFNLPKEGQKLQFRWEVFNVLNHTNFFTPINQINLATTGRITQAMSPREMQFALKYIF